VTVMSRGGGGWRFPSKYYTPPASAPPYTGFWEVWNRAVRLIRSKQPGVTIVGPSGAPGPGTGCGAGRPLGWVPQRQWLQQFLLQAVANHTMPDILSWHDYTGVPSYARSMRDEIRAWMREQPGMNADIPIGFNEIVDLAHSQNAGYHVATVAQLAGADHAVLGCWPEPGPARTAQPPVSTCWDGSMDGLVDPDADFSARPKYHLRDS
jgi:hypothetical protein